MAFLLLNNIEPPPHWHVNITHVAPVSPLHVARVTSNGTDFVPDFTVTHASEATSWTASTWLLTSTPRLFGLVAGVANPTGVVLLVVDELSVVVRAVGVVVMGLLAVDAGLVSKHGAHHEGTSSP